jgi:hypothetical protein
MTYHEVEEILGPEGNYHSGHYTVGKTGMVFRRYWLGDKGYIKIEIGRDDTCDSLDAPPRVHYKEFFPVPRQTYGERWLLYHFGYRL